MRARNSDRRFLGMAVAIFLLVGSGIGVAIVLLVGRSQLRSSSPQTVRAGDQREARPIAADLVTAIRNADAPAIRKLLDNGADAKAKDMEGRTPMFHTTFHKAKAVAKLLQPFED